MINDIKRVYIWYFDLIVKIKVVLVLKRQLMDDISKVDPLSFHFMYHSSCCISYSTPTYGSQSLQDILRKFSKTQNPAL